MKTAGIRQVKNGLSDFIKRSQSEDVVVVRRGRPVAVVVGVEGSDFEDIYWGMNDDLLRTIHAGRAGRRRMYSDEEARRLLGIGPGLASPKRERGGRRR